MTELDATRLVLNAACEEAGLSPASARLLRAHSNTVYLLPTEQTVARISHNEHHGLRARASVAITRWLADHDIPVTEPRIDHAIDIDTVTVTFWQYYPQTDLTRPPAGELGAILARLHALPPPPFDLPDYPPLAGLAITLRDPTTSRALTEHDRHWLTERTCHLIEQYHLVDSELGRGMVHGDAYPGNTLWGPRGVLLGDWDEISIAPRELDLMNTIQGLRFGTSESEIIDFVAAYGWDVRQWDGFALLREMRDLHTLNAYIRQASQGDSAAERELNDRLRTLRNPEFAEPRWNALG
ncbi:aminoglycoside phosphotransferase family protein [Nocardia sp. NBC_00403]|uniref:aminoglycoside phosphotransferase family protein n=1 Tax=Nocardia sp. NBC_00403 TaxID=2975990 RepID=UPI002E24A0FE